MDVQIDAVQKGPGNLTDIAADFPGRTGTDFVGAIIAAAAGIHGGDEHAARRIGKGRVDPGNVDLAIFQGLAHDLQDRAGKLGQLVQKEDAVVGQRHFTGLGDRTAADEAVRRNGVVRAAEGPFGHHPVLAEEAGYGVNLGHLQRFLQIHRRQNGRQALGQHGLARPGRADHEDVVAAGGGDFEGPLGQELALDLGKIGTVDVLLRCYTGYGSGL